MQKKALALLLLLLTSCLAWAQNVLPVIQVEPFTSRGVGSEERAFIESLVLSYVSDLAELVYQIDNTQTGAFSSKGRLFSDSWEREPDFILSGNIYLERKMRVFTLEIRNARSGQVFSSTTTHNTPGDLALRVRSLVENVFKLPLLNAVP